MQIKLKDITYFHNNINDEFKFENFNLLITKQHTTIIGSTGSGKSTLLELLSGIEIIKNGTVELLDYQITKKTRFKELKKLRKECAVVFQNTENQFSETFVYNELILGPKNHQMDLAVAKKDAFFMIERIGLTKDDLKKNINNFSGGQKRKLAIASMLMLRPKMIILDEPTIGLDPYSKKDLMTFIYDYTNKYNIDLLIVSHDPYVIFNYSDEIIRIKAAEVAFQGSVKEFRDYCFKQQLTDYFPKEEVLLYKFNKKLNTSFTEIDQVREYVKNKSGK